VNIRGIHQSEWLHLSGWSLTATGKLVINSLMLAHGSQLEAERRQGVKLAEFSWLVLSAQGKVF